MDDIFYMTSRDVHIKDINETAQIMNVNNTCISKTLDVIEIEYSDKVVASWCCMSLEDFHEAEDKKFLLENHIKSIYCISYHANRLGTILPHIKMLLHRYGGFIGNDDEGFQPCYDMENIDMFTFQLDLSSECAIDIS